MLAIGVNIYFNDLLVLLHCSGQSACSLLPRPCALFISIYNPGKDFQAQLGESQTENLKLTALVVFLNTTVLFLIEQYLTLLSNWLLHHGVGNILGMMPLLFWGFPTKCTILNLIIFRSTTLVQQEGIFRLRSMACPIYQNYNLGALLSQVHVGSLI